MNAINGGDFNVFPQYNSPRDCRVLRGIGWVMVGGAALGEAFSIVSGNIPGMAASAVIAGGGITIASENNNLNHISRLTED